MMCPAVLFCVLALYLHQGETIRCYECDSDTDSGCLDPIASGLETTECNHRIANFFLKFIDQDSIEELCGKSVLEQKGSGKRRIQRFCSYVHPTSCVLKDIFSEGEVTFCDSCNTDGCNGASGVLPSALPLLVVASAVLISTLKL